MKRVIRATDDGALDMMVEPERRWHLHEICLTLDAPGDFEWLEVVKVSGAGAAYNVRLFAEQMYGVQDIHFKPERPIFFDDGDGLHLDWLNSTAATYGVEVIITTL